MKLLNILELPIRFRMKTMYHIILIFMSWEKERGKK